MNTRKQNSADFSNMRFVSNGERVPFRCQLCGKCCRHTLDSVMPEPPDIFYLTRYLTARNDSIVGTEDVLERYAHPILLGEGFPVFVLNTEGWKNPVSSSRMAGAPSMTRTAGVQAVPVRRCSRQQGQGFQLLSLHGKRKRLLCLEWRHRF